MKQTHVVRNLAMALALALSGAAYAQVNININLAPPAPVHEAVPVMAPGYVWAPGYWAWSNDRHVWVRGRSMVQRTGYRWQPDSWEQRNGTYYRHAGRWERDGHFKAENPQKLHKVKHDNGRRHDEKKDKGHKHERDNGH